MNEKLSKRENECRPGEPAENSVPGLNDNLEFLGRQLHVQTERIGFPAPRIVTQVFSNGRVVFSKKTELPAQGFDSKESAAVQGLMRTQHLQTIREIKEKQRRILAAPKVS
jgi:hypothetical protein